MTRRLALAAVLLLAFGCSTPPRVLPDGAALTPDEADSFRDARSAFEGGDAEETLELVEPAAAREPWHVPSHQLRQDAFTALSRETQAREWYSAEAASHPEDAARALLAARLTSRLDGARETAYRAALKLDPSSPWARIALAYELVRVAADDHARATAFADTGFRVDADAARAHARSARAEATDLAESVVADRPDLAEAHGVLADVLMSGIRTPGDPRAPVAGRAAEEAARIDPASAAAWARVGRSRHERADDAGAAEALKRAVSLAPDDAGSWKNLGRVLLELRKDSDARSALEEAARLAPADAEVALNHAVALFRLGKTEAAAREFARAAKLTPSDPRPFEGIALARAELGQRDAAAEAMESYLANGGTDRDAARRFIDEMRGGEQQQQ